MTDNPNIADLSDSNRPTKLAESFSELYDNEWTNAFEELQKMAKIGDTDAVKCLFDLLKVKKTTHMLFDSFTHSRTCKSMLVFRTGSFIYKVNANPHA